ncbi:MAG: AAA family ATPase, partial [Candidatus Limnocylindrales bacterium]
MTKREESSATSADLVSPWTGIVGRVPESEAVEAFLIDLMDGSGRATGLLIEGDAGLGKSMLWRAALSLARRRGIRVIACAPAAAEQALSFVALRDLLGAISADDIDRLPPPQAHALGSAMLLLAADDSVDQGAVGVALTTVLRRWGSEGPLLIAIDDSQWLDSPSARVVGFAVRRLTDSRIGLLLTRRSDEPAALFDAAALALEPHVRRLQLGPISFGGLHRILTSRTGHRFARPLVARIESSSGGNPMTAIEIGRALIDSGVTGLEPGQPLPVPERLRDLLDARLTRL